MKTVLIPTKLDKVAQDVLKANGNYQVVQDDSGDLAGLCAKYPEAHALIVRSEEVTAAVIDALPRLKVVVRAGAGFNTIDIKYARKRGVDVMNTPGANANAVAEEVIALMLADARHLIKADASCRAGEWEKKAFMGREIAGKTVGIVGLGNIGRLVIARLSGFNCRFLGYDPLISPDRAAQMEVELVDLETLCAQSDYISLHIPETPETKKMFGVKLLGVMKKGATLINCARAGVIDEAALRQVKAEKGLRYLNDVYPKDEPGPKSVADVADIMVPHLGASTKEANQMAARRAAEQLIDLDEKGLTSYIVNRDIPEGLDRAYCDLAYVISRVAGLSLGKQTNLTQVGITCYGALKPFENWLLVPLVSALWKDMDYSMDPKAAVTFMASRGVAYQSGGMDDRKGFANSIAVELTGSMDVSTLRQVTVRGTVAEGTVMVSRINQFDRLYFEPKGHVVCFQYIDRTGVVGRIGAALGAAKLNIEDVRHSHHAASSQSLAIFRLNSPCSKELVAKVATEINAVMSFAATL